MRFEMIACAFRHREMAFQILKREVLTRYKGSTLGVLWSLLTPLLLLLTYTYFFSFVFKARWDATNWSGLGDYAIVLFVGLIVHGIFSECFNRAPSLIVSNQNYVKKIIFPLEILPWIAIGNALFHAGVSLGVLLLVVLLFGHGLSWTVLLLPTILLPFVLMMAGLTWFLAGVGVYCRDIGQATGLISSVLLFVSPIFYSLSILPSDMQTLAKFNPLTLIIVELRNIILFNTVPNWYSLLIYSVISVFISWGGFLAFQKMRKGFADVL